MEGADELFDELRRHQLTLEPLQHNPLDATAPDARAV
jgi:hypothetical protein